MTIRFGDKTQISSVTGTEILPITDASNIDYKITVDEIRDYSESQNSTVSGEKTFSSEVTIYPSSTTNALIIKDSSGVNSFNIKNTTATNQSFYIGNSGNLTNTSSQNVSVGYGLNAITTGGYSATLGYGNLSQMTTGNRNVAIGDIASRDCGTSISDSVAIGYASMLSVTGNGNIAIGSSSGRSISGGGSNITGTYGVFLGLASTASADGNTNEVVIGANAIGNGSNTVTLGDDNVTDVYANEDGSAMIHGSAFAGTIATCSTASATAEKAVILSGFKLVSGVTILVNFTNANTATIPTLNVNSTGAVAIYDENGIAVSATNPAYFPANSNIEFIYNGTYWIYKNKVIDSYVNGTSWYKIWSNGWIEQGGLHDHGSSSSGFSDNVPLLINHKDTNYSIFATLQDSTGSIRGHSAGSSSSTSVCIVTYISDYGTTSNAQFLYWHTKGY